MRITGTVFSEEISGTQNSDQISGLAGNDALYGNGGRDTLDGGDGDDLILDNDSASEDAPDDTLTGGAGNDTLVTSWGQDIVNPGAGDDIVSNYYATLTYLYKAGDGHDVLGGSDYTGDGIPDSFSQGNETLVFDASIARGDVLFESASDPSDLVIRFRNQPGDSITVKGHYSLTHSVGKLDRIRFADGSEIDATLIGTDGPQEISGTEVDNTLDGKGGNDALYGNGGRDTLDGGDGDDLILAGLTQEV